jgi:hypothetical protein
MKKIDTQYILANTGMPIKSGTIDHIFNALSDTCVATFNSLNNNYDPTRPCVLYGCVDTSTGGTCTISEGAVIWNEELFFVPATSFTINNVAIAVISTSYVVGANADPVLMTDGVNRNVHAIRTIEIVDGSSATPNYVADLTDFIYGDRRTLLEEHDYSVSITANSPATTTLHTMTMAHAGNIWFLYDNQVTPNASGGGGTASYLTFYIEVNGVNIISKQLSIVDDGGRRDFTMQKVLNLKIGDVVVFKAGNTLNSRIVPVVGRLVIQSNRVIA